MYHSVKFFDINYQLNKIKHEEKHINLLKDFKNVKVVETKSGENLYQSCTINSIANIVEFIEENPSGYSNFNYAMIYRDVKVDCDECDGLIRMTSDPYKIPLFVHYGSTYYMSDRFFYTMAFKDFMKDSNIADDIIVQSTQYVISCLEELQKKNVKFAETFLSSNVKNVLPFK